MKIKSISEIETSLQKLSNTFIISEIAENYINDFSKYRKNFYNENGFITEDLEYEIIFNPSENVFEKVEGTQLPLKNEDITPNEEFNKKYFVSPSSIYFNDTKFDGLAIDAYGDIDNMSILLFLFSQKNIKTFNNTKRQKSKKEEIFKYISKKISFMDYFLNFYSYDEKVYNKFIELFIPKNISVTFFKNVKSGKILEVFENIDAVSLFKSNYPLNIVERDKFFKASKEDIYLKDFFEYLPLHTLNNNVDTTFIKKTLYSESGSYFSGIQNRVDFTYAYMDKCVNPILFSKGVIFMFISLFLTSNVNAIENLLKDDFENFSANKYLLSAYSEAVILFKTYLFPLIDNKLENLFSRDFEKENKIFRINKYLINFDKKYLCSEDKEFIKKTILNVL